MVEPRPDSVEASSHSLYYMGKAAPIIREPISMLSLTIFAAAASETSQAAPAEPPSAGRSGRLAPNGRAFGIELAAPHKPADAR